MNRTDCFLWPAVVLACLLMLGSAPATAQAPVQNDPGYVDLTALGGVFDVEPTIEVNIHGALLRLVAEASAAEDPDLARLLRRVRGVFVRGFDLTDVNVDAVRRHKDDLAARLERTGWNTFVRVRDRSEDINFYVRLQDEAIAGIIVMSINLIEDQTVFLNIVGDIDPEEIGRIGRKFGMDDFSDF